MRHFTPDEANALLPALEPLLEDLQLLNVRLQEAVEAAGEFHQHAKGNGHGEGARTFDPDLNVDEIRAEMAERLKFLDAMDIVLKDIELGLIDFPAIRGGTEVYLCWHTGEERVGYWHPIDGGYRQRQPLD